MVRSRPKSNLRGIPNPDRRRLRRTGLKEQGRALRLETLEKRELLAAQILPPQGLGSLGQLPAARGHVEDVTPNDEVVDAIHTVLNAPDPLNFGGTEIVEMANEHELDGNLIEPPELVQADLDYYAAIAALGDEEAAAMAFAPLADTFKLHSNPNANHTIYIDADGNTSVSGWNGGATIVAEAYDPENNGPAFSTTELLRIQNIWRQVAEDFSAFDIDVTTEDPGEAALVNTGAGDTQWGTRAILTRNTMGLCNNSCGGVAFINSFRGGYANFPGATDTPVWVFNQGEVSAAQTVSHEVGHAVGLSHDGDTRPNPAATYYGGHGTGENFWGPIMGAPFSANIVTWDAGEYSFTTNTGPGQNYGSGLADHEKMLDGYGFGYLADAEGDSIGAANLLGIQQDLFSAEFPVFSYGIVNNRNDLDFFELQTGPDGKIDLTFESYASRVYTSDGSGGYTVSYEQSQFRGGTNINIEARLFDESGNLITVSEPATELGARINVIVPAGKYYVSVDGVGHLDADTGYTDYSSIGQYIISGVVSQFEAPPFGLIAVRPDADGLLLDGDTLNVAPREFNLLFTGGARLDEATINSDTIKLVRSGGDGSFTDGNEVEVALGYVGLLEPGTTDPRDQQHVVLRPASSASHNATDPAFSFPDDYYQIQVIGEGSDPLLDRFGGVFNDGINDQVSFRLDRGAQVVSIVPQPVSRNTQAIDRSGAIGGDFTLTLQGETTDPILFNAGDTDIRLALEDLDNVQPGDVVVSSGEFTFQGHFAGEQVAPLIVDDTNLTGSVVVTALTTLSQASNQIVVYFDDQVLNEAQAIDPAYYRLVNTESTLAVGDDSTTLPMMVTYDDVTNKAVLTFAVDIPEGNFRLDVGDSGGDNSSRMDAVKVGTLFNGNHYIENGFLGDIGGSSTDTGDVDFYAIQTAAAGSSVTVEVTPHPMALDVAVEFLDKNGTVLQAPLPPGAGLPVTLTQAAPADTYYVKVSSASGTGSYLIDIVATGSPIDSSDLNSTTDSATNLGDLGAGDLIVSSQIEPQRIPLPPLLGSEDDPGHRQIQRESHIGALGTTPTLPQATTIRGYYFPANLGFDTSGNPYENLITETEKQIVRQIYEIYARVSGFEFVETDGGGTAIGKGDLRAASPGIGPNDGVAGLGGPGLVVLNGPLFNQANRFFGDGFTGTMFHEIGHSLGLSHAYDQPATMGQGVPTDYEPGDHDIVHLQRIAPPNSTDIDMYRFELKESGRLKVETIAERLGVPSYLNTALALYREVGSDIELVARNDQYFGADSYIDLELEAGVYFVGVTSTGNTNYDPRVPDSGFGGTTDGDYDLRFRFEATGDGSLTDNLGTAFDGDADGRPGGVHSFWFQSNEPDATIFIDKLADTVDGVVEGDGSIGSPYDTIEFALAQAGSRIVVPTTVDASIAGQTFVIDDGVNVETFTFGPAPKNSIDISSLTPQDIATAIGTAINDAITASDLLPAVSVSVSDRVIQIDGIDNLDVSGSESLMNTPNLVRVVGNGGIDGDIGTLADNKPYLVGFDSSGIPLPDGAEFLVPQGVTVLIHAGTLMKMRKANIDAGTSSANVSRSSGAIQVLGTPNQSVFLRSFNDDTVGGNSNGDDGDDVMSGDFGGIVFREDSDLEAQGIFLNYVNHVDILQGGGKVFVDANESVFAPIHIVDARPTVSFNRIQLSDDAAVSASPDSFDDSLERIGPDVYGNFLIDNTINGLFIRVLTPLGSNIDKLTVNGRFDDTDIPHVLTEALIINGAAGGPTSFGGSLRARPSGRLLIDPGTILKMNDGRIEAESGDGTLIAEGTLNRPVIFTSMADGRHGGSGEFDTDNAATSIPGPGDWSSLFFGQSTFGTIDNAIITFGGGNSTIEGGSASFSTIEAHQADLRVTNSLLQSNADGFSGGNRNGRGANGATTIFVRGSQPIIVDNVFTDNEGSVVSINADSMRHEVLRDYGRSTGLNEPFDQLADNHGPMVRLNELENNATNGMVVRGELLTIKSIWDDTDIVHVLQGEVIVDNVHHLGGLRLQSSNSESLVIKVLGTGSGFTATGTPVEIPDRVGGTIHVLGTVGHPVVVTDLADDSVGAGFSPSGDLMTNTNNSAAPTTGIGGNWRGFLFDEFSNDRNVAIVRELENPLTNQVDINFTPTLSQLVGTLAPNDKSGDENRRLGFEVHGFISPDDPNDVDVYGFTGTAGTGVWIDIDRTDTALDAIVEVVNIQGTVLARSVIAGAPNTGGNLDAQTLTQNPLLGGDHYTQNFRDPGFFYVLPGDVGVEGTYFVRVRSNPVSSGVTALAGESRGEYQLQIRLDQVQEFPGSTVQFADIRYAQTGIDVRGLPAHSPFIGEAGELLTNVQTGAENNGSFGSAQALVNLLETDMAALSISGQLTSQADVDWYSFDLQQTGVQEISGVNDAAGTMAVVFDLDYSDNVVRADTTVAVFDQGGNLIFVGRESDVQDDFSSDVEDLLQGTLGKKDPYIGPIHLTPGGTFYVAVMSDRYLPRALTGAYIASPGPVAGDSNALVRLEPINSVVRVVEDHIGFQGYASRGAAINPTTTAGLFDVSVTATTVTSLSGDIVAGDTSLTVADASSFPLTPQFTIRIGTEEMLVTGVAGNTFTVIRGYNRTTALDHADTATVTEVTGVDASVDTFSFQDVALYVATDRAEDNTNAGNNDHLYTVDPQESKRYLTRVTNANGLVGGVNDIQDVVIRTDGRMFGYQRLNDNVEGNDNSTYARHAGRLVEIDTSTSAITTIGDDNIPGGNPTPNVSAYNQNDFPSRDFRADQFTTSDEVDALTFRRRGTNPLGQTPEYDVFYAVREADNSSKLYRATENDGSADLRPVGTRGDFGFRGDIQFADVTYAARFIQITQPVDNAPSRVDRIRIESKIPGAAGNFTISFVQHTNNVTPDVRVTGNNIEIDIGRTGNPVNNASTSGAIVNAINNHQAASNLVTAVLYSGSGNGVGNGNAVGDVQARGAVELIFSARDGEDGLSGGPLQGHVTGLSFGTFDGSGNLFGVTNAGEFLIINPGTGAVIERIDAADTIGLDGLNFQGLALGPQNVEAGRYRNTLFAITDDGRLVSFDVAGNGDYAFPAANPVQLIATGPGADTSGGFFTLNSDASPGGPTGVFSTTDPIAVDAPARVSVNETQSIVHRGYEGDFTLSMVVGSFYNTAIPAAGAVTSPTDDILMADLSFDVEDASGLPTTFPFTIRVQNEEMLVTGVLGTTLTVTRGYNGTAAADHPHTATVFELLSSAANQGSFIFSTDTVIEVEDASVFPSAFPFEIRMDNEDMRVTGSPGVNMFDVVRGINGTTPAFHFDGRDVFRIETTAPIQWDATAAQVRNALNLLPSFAGNVTAPIPTQQLPAPVTIEFDGVFAGKNLYELTGDFSNLVGDEIQEITLDPDVTRGTFRLEFDGFTTGDIDFDASAGAIDAELEALENTISVGGNDFIVTRAPFAAGTPPTPIFVQFTDDLANTDVTLMLVPAASEMLLRNEINTLSIGGGPATGGTFTLTLDLASGGTLGTTGDINWDANAGAVRAALGTITGDVNDFIVTGGPLPGGALTIEYTGSLTATDVDLSGASSLTVGAGNPGATIVVVETRDVDAPPPIISDVRTGRTPSVRVGTTTDGVLSVQDALEGLPQFFPGDIRAAGTLNPPGTGVGINFIGTYNTVTVDALVVDNFLNSPDDFSVPPSGSDDDAIVTVTTLGSSILEPGVTGIDGGSAGSIGLAFSPLDFNLWHPTTRRSDDAGHGINPARDDTRVSGVESTPYDNTITPFDQADGGVSYHFGLEPWRNNQIREQYVPYDGVNAQYGILTAAFHADLSSNPKINGSFGGGDTTGTYNLPAGALGTLTTTPFDLTGSNADDRPTLYFSYFLETQGHGGSNLDSDPNNPFRDSARVFISTDDGANWELLASNNSQLSSASPSGTAAELPGFLSHLSDAGLNSMDPRSRGAQQVQELLDNTNQWRQARVDLSEYAGLSGLRMRIDFSTAGSVNDDTLRVRGGVAVDGEFSTAAVTDAAPFGEYATRDGNGARSIRSVDNQYEGFYVDDFIIGYAERGEMVTGTGGGDTTIVNLFANARTRDRDPAQYPDVLSGEYQLEVRRTGEYVATNEGADPTVAAIFDTDDRHIIDTVEEANVSFEPLTTIPPLTPPAATTVGGTTITSAEMVGWSVTPTNPFTGTRSLESGAVNFVQPFAVFEATAADLGSTSTDAGVIQFAFSVSSSPELNGLRFFIDGVQQRLVFDSDGLPVLDANLSSGERPYQVLQFPFGSGETRFTWVYDFSNPLPAGDNAAYVDDIVLLQGGTGLLADPNRERPQGTLILDSNFILDSSGFGINVQPGAAQAGGGVPHQGSTINFPQLNRDRLIPGVVIQNNVIAGSSGIRFAGESGQNPQRPVPFGRIINNTLVGDLQSGTGIQVDGLASPTILNNLLTDLNRGIINNGVGTIVRSNFFQANTSNGVTGPNAILAGPAEPLFVNPANNNYYLELASRAIDSSQDTEQDRLNNVTFKTELDIPPSPIFAPDRDVYGQLRISAGLPGGGGPTVFKDRGAVDRSDNDAPYATLLNPVDNDAQDKDPNDTVVHLTDQLLENFTILLSDGPGPNSPFQGTGIDGLTVDDPSNISISTQAITIIENGVTLVERVHYTVGFDPITGVLLLKPFSTLWNPTSVFEIKLNNQLIADKAGNLLRANQPDGSTTFTIIMPQVGIDFGDSPDTYRTVLDDDGARHALVNFDSPRLGIYVDSEPDSLGVDSDDIDVDVSADGNIRDLDDGPFMINNMTSNADITLMTAPEPGDNIAVTAGNSTVVFELVEEGGQSTIGRLRVEYPTGSTLDEIMDLLADAMTTEFSTNNVLATVTHTPGTTTLNIKGEDDEDGVGIGPVMGVDGLFIDPATGDFLSFLNPSAINGSELVVNVTGSGLLDAWVDFDGDGNFFDSDEQILFSEPVVDGENRLQVFTPASPGAFGALNHAVTWARFRLSTNGQLTPDRVAVDGEVEDYQVFIAETPLPEPVDAQYFVMEDPAVDLMDNLTFTSDTPVAAPITYVLQDGPTNAENFSLDVNTGAFTYEPIADFYGNDFFTYRLEGIQMVDGITLPVRSSLVGTITITVTPVNDAPFAPPFEVETVEPSDTRLPVPVTTITNAELLAAAVPHPRTNDPLLLDPWNESEQSLKVVQITVFDINGDPQTLADLETLIDVTDDASQFADTEQFSITSADGLTTEIFEFDNDTTATNIPVDISTAVTAEDVRDAIFDAISDPTIAASLGIAPQKVDTTSIQLGSVEGIMVTESLVPLDVRIDPTRPVDGVYTGTNHIDKGGGNYVESGFVQVTVAGNEVAFVDYRPADDYNEYNPPESFLPLTESKDIFNYTIADDGATTLPDGTLADPQPGPEFAEIEIQVTVRPSNDPPTATNDDLDTAAAVANVGLGFTGDPLEEDVQDFLIPRAYLLSNDYAGPSDDDDESLGTNGNDGDISLVTLQGSTTPFSIGAVNSGIAVSDSATGTGYIMYSDEDVFTRFSSAPPLNAFGQVNSDHLVAVRFNGSTWEYNNDVSWVPFAPEPTDRLLATVDFSFDTITSLQYAFGDVNGIEQGWVVGDLTFSANTFNGLTEPDEFTVDGTFFEISSDPAFPTGFRPFPLTTAAGGMIELNLSGDLEYTPPTDFYGEDSFEYFIIDEGKDFDIGGGSTDNFKYDSGTVTLTVAPVNDAPQAADDLSFVTPEGTTLTITAAELVAGSVGHHDPQLGYPFDESNQDGFPNMNVVELTFGTNPPVNASNFAGPFLTDNYRIDNVMFDANDYLISFDFTPLGDFNADNPLQPGGARTHESFEFTIEDNGVAVLPLAGPGGSTGATLLPVLLADGGGYTWDIENDGSILNGTFDAFDTGLANQFFAGNSSTALTEENGREIVLGPETVGPLELVRKVFVPDDDNFARFLEIYSNPGTTPVTQSVSIVTNLGSDNNTVVVDTSSGDQLLTPADDWVVTADLLGLDPAVGHVMSGIGGLDPTTFGLFGNDFVVSTFDLTINPGETRILMSFAIQDFDSGQATTQAAALHSPTGPAIRGMSPLELASVVNFDLSASVPPLMTIEPPDTTKERDSATATILVTPQNDDPALQDDLITSDDPIWNTFSSADPTEDQTLIIPAAFLFDNDENAPATAGDELGLLNDSSGLSLVPISFTTDLGGTVELINGDLHYTPPADAFGLDTFEYRAIDQGIDEDVNGFRVVAPHEGVATVSILIDPVNDRPTSTPRSFPGTEDTVISFDAEDLLQLMGAEPALPSVSPATGNPAFDETEQQPTLRIVAFADADETVDVDELFASGDNGTGALTMTTVSGGLLTFNFDSGAFIDGTYDPGDDYNRRTPFSSVELFRYIVADDGTTTVPGSGLLSGGGPDTVVDLDDARSLPIDVTITIDHENDAPSFDFQDEVNVLERDDNGVTVVGDWATNVFPGPPTALDELQRESVRFTYLSAESTVPSGLFRQDPVISPTGALSVFPNQDEIGTATIVVEVQDVDNVTPGFVPFVSKVTFTLNVQPVNDQPTLNPTLLGTTETLDADHDYSIANDGVLTISLKEDNTQADGTPAPFVIPMRTGPGPGYELPGLLDLFEVGPANEISAEVGGSQFLDLFVFPATTALGGSLQPVTNGSGDIVSLEYTPPEDYNNTIGAVDSFVYEVIDKSDTGNETWSLSAGELVPDQLTASNVVQLNLNPVNDRPQFAVNANELEVAEGRGPQQFSGFAFNLAAGPLGTATDETDPINGQSVSFLILPTNFQASQISEFFTTPPQINSSGLLEYEAEVDAFGQFEFDIVLMDDGAADSLRGDVNASLPTQLTINVRPVNDSPVINPTIGSLSFSTMEDTALVIPADGSSTIGDLLGSLNPGPDNEAAAIDPGGNQTLTIDSGFPLTTTEGGTLTPIINGGEVTGYTYDPPANYVGQDSFVYSVTDDGETVLVGTNGNVISDPQSESFTVTLNIQAVNDAPVLQGAENVTLNEDPEPRQVVIPNWASGIAAGPSNAIDELIGPDAQSVSVNLSTISVDPGLFDTPPAVVLNGNSVTLTFEPAVDANGSGVFGFSVIDDGSGIAPNENTTIRTFTISIDAQNDPPTFTPGGKVTIPEDFGAYQQTGWATDISPGPGDEQLTQTVVGFDVVVPVGSQNLFAVAPAISADGTLTFTPADDASGTVDLEVTAIDSEGGRSAVVTLPVTIDESDDSPVPQDDRIDTDEDIVIIIDVADLLANDLDPDLLTNPAEMLSIVSVDPISANGALITFEPSGGTVGEIIYNPLDAEAIQELTPEQQLQDSFSYTIRDLNGEAMPPSADVILTIQGVNDEPIVGDDRLFVLKDGQAILDVYDNDVDVDGEVRPETVVITQQPSEGALAVDETTGELTYVPKPGFEGTDVFRYTVADDRGQQSEQATVVVVVSTHPQTVDDVSGTFLENPVDIPVLDNDLASPIIPIDPTSIVIESGPDHGLVEPQPDGTVRYTPEDGYLGPDSFTYTVADEDGRRSEITNVDLNVVKSNLQNPVNFHDVNASGQVTSLDALLIINKIAQADGVVSIPVDPDARGPNFYDVNGDGSISGQDAIIVINQLAQQANSGEPELIEASVNIGVDLDRNGSSLEPMMDRPQEVSTVEKATDKIVGSASIEAEIDDVIASIVDDESADEQSLNDAVDAVLMNLE